MGDHVRVLFPMPDNGHLFRYVTNQPSKANSAFHPSMVSKLVPASAGKAKASMVHSVRGLTWGVQVDSVLASLAVKNVPYLSTVEVCSR